MAISKKQTAGISCAAISMCVISAIIGAAIAGKFNVTWGERFSADFGQSISIILSALGAILTALALLFGLLAIVGWATFSRQVDLNVQNYMKGDFERKGPLFISISKDLAIKLADELPDKLIPELLPVLERKMFAGVEPADDQQLDNQDEGGAE